MRAYSSAGGAGSDGSTILAEGLGLLYETFPRATAGGQLVAVSGTVYYSLFPALAGYTYSAHALDVKTPVAASLTLARLAIVDPADGAILAQTGNVAADFNGASGMIAPPFASPLAGDDRALYAAMIFVGLTPPTIARGSSTFNSQRIAGEAFPFGVLAGQADIPATAPVSGNAPAFWMGHVGA